MIRWMALGTALASCQSVEVQGRAAGADTAGPGEGAGEGEGQGRPPCPAGERRVGGACAPLPDDGPGGGGVGGRGGEGEGEGAGEGEGEADGPWSSVLAAHVRDDCTDYVGLAADAAAVQALQRHLAALAVADPAALGSAAERLAFWLNAYNALTVSGVLTGLAGDPDFSTAGPDRNSFEFFNDTRHRVAGADLRLDDIEHGVIRGVERSLDRAVRWHEEVFPAGTPTDARIHAALNCGARSCPSLPAAPFRGDRLDEQLDARVARWLDDPAKGAGGAGISSLFDWFADDFVADAGSVRGFVERHRTGGADGVDLETFLTYDWSLNRCP